MEFPTQEKPVIIATKGLYTANEFVAGEISAWAKIPLFSLDYILEELYEEGGYFPDRRPSEEEDERLHRLAFSRLCKAASFPLLQRPSYSKFNCVVLDSLLSSKKELDQLIELSIYDEGEAPLKLVIIEVRFKHKYTWVRQVEWEVSQNGKWFLPRSWVEVEEAIRDYRAKHGGHHHLMKLRMPTTITTSTSTGGRGEDQLAFSSDDYLDPDDLWCEVCYQDLNSQAGFYVCQDCPEYVAHIFCINPIYKGYYHS